MENREPLVLSLCQNSSLPPNLHRKVPRAKATKGETPAVGDRRERPSATETFSVIRHLGWFYNRNRVAKRFLRKCDAVELKKSSSAVGRESGENTSHRHHSGRPTANHQIPPISTSLITAPAQFSGCDSTHARKIPVLSPTDRSVGCRMSTNDGDDPLLTAVVAKKKTDRPL